MLYHGGFLKIEKILKAPRELIEKIVTRPVSERLFDTAVDGTPGGEGFRASSKPVSGR